MATTGQEQFSYEYIGKTYIKKLFAEFETDLVQMVLGWTSNKIAQINLICWKTLPPGGGVSFSYV